MTVLWRSKVSGGIYEGQDILHSGHYSNNNKYSVGLVGVHDVLKIPVEVSLEHFLALFERVEND